MPQSPSRWYLTGFLVPLEAGEEQRADETFEEEVDELDEIGATDDTDTPEPAAAKRAFFPSSMGLGLLVTRDSQQAMVTVRWGDYKQEITNAEVEKEDDSGIEDVTRDPATKSNDSGDKDRGNDSNEKGRKSRSFPVWKRTQRAASTHDENKDRTGDGAEAQSKSKPRCPPACRRHAPRIDRRSQQLPRTPLELTPSGQTHSGYGDTEIDTASSAHRPHRHPAGR